jgi:hypothetical protein
MASRSSRTTDKATENTFTLIDRDGLVAYALQAPRGFTVSHSSKTYFVSSIDDLALKMAQALGLKDKGLRSFQLNVEADKVITVRAENYVLNTEAEGFIDAIKTEEIVIVDESKVLDASYFLGQPLVPPADCQDPLSWIVTEIHKRGLQQMLDHCVNWLTSNTHGEDNDEMIVEMAKEAKAFISKFEGSTFLA